MLNKIYVRYLMASNMPRMFELIQTRIWCEQMFAQWINNLDLQKNDEILDVGCGPGVLTQSLAKTGCNATGLDQSEGMLALARRSHSDPSEKLGFKQGDALDLSFPDNQFNIVIAASLINIISDPDKALNEMFRSVKPGGKVSFLVPSIKMNLNNVRDYCKSNKIRGLAASLLDLWASNAICLSAEDAKTFAKKSNLKNIVVHQYLDEMVITVTGIKPD